MAKWKGSVIFLFLNLLLLIIIFGIFKSHVKYSINPILKLRGDEHDHTMADGTMSHDTDLLIPDDHILDKMSQYDHLAFYQRYINTIQAHCRNIIRVGSLRDGGKEICVDEAYKPKAPCLVYSFGISNRWDFDYMAADIFGCEVHCFDPSINKTTEQITDQIWFYDIGLGDRDWTDDRKWDIRTLNTIKKDLKHTDRPIDILKMDIESDEWKAIPQMIESGALDDVKQIAIELHFPFLRQIEDIKWRTEDTNMPLYALRKLYQAGFRIVMRERNICRRCVQQMPHFKYPLTHLYEVTLININLNM